MPGLISSATPGKQAAPKAPARRRPAASPAVPAPSRSSTTPGVAQTTPPPSAQVQNNLDTTQSASKLAPQPRKRQNLGPVDSNLEKSGTRNENAEGVEQATSTVPESQKNDVARNTRTTRSSNRSKRLPESGGRDAEDRASNQDSSAEHTLSIVPGTPSSRTRASEKRAHTGEDNDEAGRSAKRTKRSSVRSNAVVQSEQHNTNSALSSVEEPHNPSGVTSKTRASGSTTGNPPAGTRKRQRKTKNATPGTNSQEHTEQQDLQQTETDSQESPQSRRRRRGRSSPDGDGEEDEQSEDNPELHEIDPNTLSMFELSYDKTHGKPSEREKKMAEIDWDEIARKRREHAQRIAMGRDELSSTNVIPSVEGVNGTADQTPAQSGNIEFTVNADGQIVANESSLTINRYEAAEAAARSSEAIEDENDLILRINRTTWVNENRRDPVDRVPMWKSKSDPWSEEDTDRFYDALRMFGTDFYIISKMFPGKTRRHIKNKFVREERLDPPRINNALLGKETKPMDLDHYARETGRDVSVYTKYDGVEHAQGIINESMKDRQQAMTVAVAEQAAMEKERVETEKQKALEKRRAGKKARKARANADGTLDDQ